MDSDLAGWMALGTLIVYFGAGFLLADLHMQRVGRQMRCNVEAIQRSRTPGGSLQAGSGAIPRPLPERAGGSAPPVMMAVEPPPAPTSPGGRERPPTVRVRQAPSPAGAGTVPAIQPAPAGTYRRRVVIHGL